jgi:hypothetical protein
MLEHVREPEALLAKVRETLAPHGLLIVSTANIANVAMRVTLLFGKFEYGSRGILDRTHLRFFTRKSVRKALEHAGYEVVVQKMTVIPVELVPVVSSSKILVKMINGLLRLFTPLFPGLLGYETILVAKTK